MSGVGIMAQCGADAGDFVCRDARPNAGSTHHNSTLGRSTPYGLANETGDIWEVDRIEAVCAKVLDLMTLRAQEINHPALERKATMIATNAQFHDHLLISSFSAGWRS